MPKNSCIMQIWAEPEKSALPICNYSQILYQFLTFTQNLKRSRCLSFELPVKLFLLVQILRCCSLLYIFTYALPFGFKACRVLGSFSDSAVKLSALGFIFPFNARYRSFGFLLCVELVLLQLLVLLLQLCVELQHVVCFVQLLYLLGLLRYSLPLFGYC